jgi:glutathione reductase (NADPH)
MSNRLTSADGLPHPTAADAHADPYDLIVLGAGSGGLAGAKRAAALGARVLIIEADRVGGTCVLRGCIPKKLMVYAAALGDALRLAPAYGWAAAPTTLSWPKLCQERDALLDRLEANHRNALQRSGVTLVAGHASFVDAHTVRVGNTTYRGRNVLVATGGAPVVPAIPGIDYCLDSDGFFRLPERPACAAIVGGGYIAVEFACLLRSLGCDVHMFVRSRLLRDFDAEVGEHVHQAMVKAGIHVHTGTQVQRIVPGEGGVRAVHAHGPGGDISVQAGACVVFATGRLPQTDALALAAAGIKTAANGAICVDDAHATSAANVYAVGDVIDRVNLTPVAIRAARSVVEACFGSRRMPVDYDNVATAVFSHPPIGAVGLTEAQAKAAHGDAAQVFVARFTPLKYAVAGAEYKVPSLMKLIVHRDTDRVLGFHMAGDDAPEIIQGFAAALQAGITKTQLDQTVAVHPTAAEEFVLMR